MLADLSDFLIWKLFLYLAYFYWGFLVVRKTFLAINPLSVYTANMFSVSLINFVHGIEFDLSIIRFISFSCIIVLCS